SVSICLVRVEYLMNGLPLTITTYHIIVTHTKQRRTGYFPSKTLPNIVNPIIHLMDLNPNSLEKTSQRLKKYSPISHLHNVFDPVPNNLPLFKSIAAINFFHCLPGTMLEKEIVITNLKKLLKNGGVFYGATVLGEGLNVGKIFEKTNAYL
ncbi:MAG: class I SAM-dependent methyltransferase, partial [Desulfobacterales bacterium]|nr:class I SAM-dependent methyltransferase [Desulfobacterales bacterium]